MLVGVPREIKTHEYRVGLTTGSVSELVHHGHVVIVETMAGAGIGLSDEMYRRAGAEITGFVMGPVIGGGLYSIGGLSLPFLVLRGAALIALTTAATGSQRLGIAPLVVLFLIGLFLLSFVKPKGESVP